MASTPSSSATSTIWSSASRLSCATVVLMLTRSGALLAPRRRLQPAQPGARALERALQAARGVVQLAGPSIETLMCLRKPGRREIGQRFGPLFGDDRAVGRQVAAGVALLAEEIEHGHDVLPHEDLAAGQADLEAGVVGERAAQRVERQLLAPLALDVQQVADVAELAVQVAPHRRFVDDALRQPIGAAGLLVDEPADPLLVPAPPVSRPRMARERQRAGARGNRLPQPGRRTNAAACGGSGRTGHVSGVTSQCHRVARSPAVDRDAPARCRSGYRCCAGKGLRVPARPRSLRVDTEKIPRSAGPRARAPRRTGRAPDPTALYRLRTTNATPRRFGARPDRCVPPSSDGST